MISIKMITRCLIVVLLATVQAHAEGIALKGSDIILPSGGRLVFADGTNLSSSAEKGITTAVHGIVGPDGSSAANNCTVAHVDTGSYSITFAQSLFSSPPICVMNAVGHPQTNTGFVDCELSAVPTTSSVSITCMKYLPTNNPPAPYQELFYDTAFTFICMN